MKKNTSNLHSKYSNNVFFKKIQKNALLFLSKKRLTSKSNLTTVNSVKAIASTYTHTMGRGDNINHVVKG